LQSGTYESFLAGQSRTGIFSGAEAKEPLVGAQTELEVRIPGKRAKKLREWDKLLKNFRHGDTLDSVMQPVRGVAVEGDCRVLTSDGLIIQGLSAPLVFAVITELIHRDALHTALSGRDDLSLAPILRFLLKHITDPRFGVTACDVLNVIIGSFFPLFIICVIALNDLPSMLGRSIHACIGAVFIDRRPFYKAAAKSARRDSFSG
jgi:U3 small nucleolar RNA-associated protein 15